MSEEDKQKILQAFEKVFEEVRRIVKEIAKVVVPIIRKIAIDIIKIVNDRKACKCLHIWLHTKNKRIRKKQIKRLNKIILSYML